MANKGYGAMPQMNGMNGMMDRMAMMQQMLPMMMMMKMCGMDPKDMGFDMKNMFSTEKTKEKEIDFDTFERKSQVEEVNKDYLNEDGDVQDVKMKESTVKFDERGERKNAKNNGLLDASSDTISVITTGDYSGLNAENNGSGTGNNATQYLKDNDIIKDNKVDLKAAKEKRKEIEKDPKYVGLDASKMTANDDDMAAGKDLDYKKFGLDVKEDGSLTKTGKKQLEKLKQQGLVDDQNTLTADAKEGFAKQKKANLEVKLLNEVSTADDKHVGDRKAKVYVQTGDKNDANNSQLVDVDNEGNVKGLNKDANVDASTAKIKTNLDKKAEKQLTAGSEDADKILQKHTKVDENGNVTIDMEKMTGNEIAEINKKGLSFNGAGNITIKGKEDQKLNLNLGENATNVDLQGGNFNINKKEGTALQIKADAKSEISKLEGANLEHLVVDGGKINTDIQLDKLEALKIKNSELKKDIKIENGKEDLVANLENVTAEGDVAIQSAHDAQVKIKDSKIAKKVSVTGDKDARLDMQGTKAGDVDITADNNTIFGGDKKTKINNLKVNSEKATITADGMEANEINASEVKGDTGVFLGAGTKIKDLKLNKATKDKNEIVLEDKDNEDLKKIANGSGSKDKAKVRGMEKEDVLTYLGWSEEKYKSVQKQQENAYANPYGNPYGAPQPRVSKLELAAQGFLTGVNQYNQMNPNMGYGMNPGMGMGYQQQPRQYGWMQQGYM